MHACLLIRHGLAGSEAPGTVDAERPLSEEGAAEIEQIGSGLAALQRPPRLILTSPYLRTVQTAERIAAAFGGIPVEPVESLASGVAPGDLLDVVCEYCPGDRGDVAVVGHEPDLGRFASYALAGTSRSFYALHKGAACLLEFPALPRAGTATLEWALEPGHLLAVAASVRARGGRRRVGRGG